MTPRLSVGPELLFIQGEHHSHLVATGNVTLDLRQARVTPFIVAGGGAFQTRYAFPGGDYTSWEGAFTAGGGVRGSVTPRVSVGVDARLGWELHLRLGGVVGIRLGR